MTKRVVYECHCLKVELLIFLIGSVQAIEVGFSLPGRSHCSGVSSAIAGRTQLKVGNKPQKRLILKFSYFRDKEPTQVFFDSFSHILMLKVRFNSFIPFFDLYIVIQWVIIDERGF